MKISDLIVYNMRYQKLCSLTDNSGVCATDIVEKYSLNEITELTFKYPIVDGNEKYMYLSNENLVKYNGEFYRIKTLVPQHSDDGKKTLDVTCRHKSEALQYSTVTMEEQTPKTVKELMKIALRYENDEPTLGWSVGIVTVDGITKRGLESVEDSVFSILTTIAEKYNGILRFNSSDNTVDLLKMDSQSPPKFDLSISKDLKNLKITYDTSEMITRLYCFGANDDDGNEINIMSVNPTGKAYVENYDYFLNLGYTADEIKSHPELFLKTTIWRDSNYYDAQDLYDDGVKKVADMSVPTISVDINALDLSQFGNYRTSSLSIGDVVKVIDTDLGAEFNCNITSITRSSSEPHVLNISVTNLIQYKDILAKLFSSVSTSNTIISAGGKVNGSKVEHIKTYQIDDLSAKYIDADTINANYATLKYLNTNYLTAENIKATYADFDTIDALNVNIKNINTDILKVKKAIIQKADVEEFYATNANVKTLNADVATINTLVATKASIEDLTATNANVTTLQTDLASANTLIAQKANIDLANVTDGAIKTAMIDTGAVKTAQIADGSITDAKIVGLTANKITAGTLDAADIDVVNLNAANITVGTINGQQIAPGAIDTSKLGSDVTNSISTAQETADGKNKILYSATEPTGSFSVGDTWFDTDDGYKIYKWNGTQWTANALGMSALDESVNTTINNASTDAAEAKTTADSVVERADNREFDAATIYIHSSSGTSFKNNAIDTVLSVTIFHGGQTITDKAGLISEFGSGAYLQWSVRKYGDTSFTTIIATDSHFSNDCFSYTVGSDDIDTQAVFSVQLIV